MQITHVEVIPVELKLKKPACFAHLPAITHVTAIFVHVETRQGQSAWGCTVAHPDLTGESPANVLHACQECAVMLPDLHPLNTEFTLAELSAHLHPSPATLCAFDLALHELLGLSSGMPLYRILGGYRNRIRTSITIPCAAVDEVVDLAQERASQGFRILKVKGGLEPEEDVRRVQALHQALPHHVLRLDADGGYTVQQALDVTRALDGILEMIEQPTPAGDLLALRQVKEISPVPVLADQSVCDAASALEVAAHHTADGLSVKLVACGGLQAARQIDAIARAAHLSTMVGCFIEPSLLISAGLSLALSSPNVRYGDLDGHFDLLNDPSLAGFRLEDGWLVATDVPGLGYTVTLD